MKFKIKTDESGKGEIFLDGKDISMGCYGFNISAKAMSTVDLELLVRGDIEIEGKADTYMRLPNGEKFKLA